MSLQQDITREDIRCLENEVRQAASSFYWPMRLQPQRERLALYAIYAYCRVLDDIADGNAPTADKRNALAAWRKCIDDIYSGRPDPSDDAVSRTLAKQIEIFDLPRAPLDALIDGMEWDLNDRSKPPTWDELNCYCDQVAGSVGILCLQIWGWSNQKAEDCAIAAGRAVQLTNILRDLHEDAGRARCYMPQESLTLFGLERASPTELIAEPSLKDAALTVAAEAREKFTEAEQLIAYRPGRQTRFARLILAVYSEQLAAVCRSGFTRPASPVRLGKWRKLAAALPIYLRLK